MPGRLHCSIEGVGVAHIQIRGYGVARGIVVGVAGQVQADAFEVGEPVVLTVLVGERFEAERRVVRDRAGEVGDREDGVKAPQLPGCLPYGTPKVVWPLFDVKGAEAVCQQLLDKDDSCHCTMVLPARQRLLTNELMSRPAPRSRWL